ncbi:uncharacterized protein [Spinacia oleracea]|uniref:CCHC-type domain-containing protein n=1 Tax=Spinacia oleracea TaxID=3562 RepID=A0A9R0J971_SPIOL|nr:uncharacterized protein LOC110802433 [Spinacia oleracea]
MDDEQPLIEDNHSLAQTNSMVKAMSQITPPHNVSTIQTNPAPLSFRDVVDGSTLWFNEAKKIKDTTLEWEDPPCEPPNSTSSVTFTKPILDKLREPWKLTLMGKCLGIYVRPSFLTQRVRIMWRPKGNLEVIDLGNNVYLFRFSLADDYEKALLGEPWFILDHYLMITKWKPNFRPSTNPFESMTVWIRFPELPVEYYDKQALFEIAKVVGNPIRVDYATNNLTRARYARVCLDLDLSKSLVTSVWVVSQWQRVEYENIHSLCFSCGKIGHSKEKCGSAISASQDKIHADHSPNATSSSTIQALTLQTVLPNQASHISTHGENASAEKNETQGEYGPWTLVTNKKKHKTK